MKNRRALLKSLSVIGGAAAVSGAVAPKSWTTPIINAVMTPAHAQTSGTQLSCSMTDTALTPIAEGATHNEDLILTFSTTPPEPGSTIDWVGRCNGTDDFAVQTDTLDDQGELVITVNTSLLCSGGPPNVGDVILHNGVLNTSGSETSCSFVYGP